MVHSTNQALISALLPTVKYDQSCELKSQIFHDAKLDTKGEKIDYIKYNVYHVQFYLL